VCLSWYCLSLGMETVSVYVYLTILVMNFVDYPADLITVSVLVKYIYIIIEFIKTEIEIAIVTITIMSNIIK
jgi:hypothetical protein